jgi:hypothetical protein
MKPRGRRQPYTEIGIGRVACARCGKPSRYQWNCCATGNRWMAICEACDIDLNRVVLRFFRFPDWRALLARYAAKVRGGSPVNRHRPKVTEP